MKTSIASTATRDAPSPATCPPIPSATMYSPRSGRERKLSSLLLRRRPGSDVTAHENVARLIFAPFSTFLPHPLQPRPGARRDPRGDLQARHRLRQRNPRPLVIDVRFLLQPLGRALA